MLQPLFLTVVLFIPPTFAAQPAPAEAAPATQPASVEQQQDADTESLAALLGRTRVAQLAEGKRRVTLADVRDPVFWVDTTKDLAVTLILFVPRLIVAGMFLCLAWVIYRTVRRVLTGALGTAGVDDSIRDMLGHLLKWTIMGFGVVIACNQIGIQIAALLTGVSIIGLAVGFAAKETLENFIAGIVIFWDKPFKLGDWLDIDGVFAQVQRVTFRSTRLLNTAGEILVFPNTTMLSSKLCNHTTHPLQRVRVDIGIAYKESIEAARQALLPIVKGDDRILAEPEPCVVVMECAGSSVNLVLFFWIRDESIQKKLRAEYIEKAKLALDAAGIQIPYPHMQLFLEQTPAVAALAGQQAPQEARAAA